MVSFGDGGGSSQTSYAWYPQANKLEDMYNLANEAFLNGTTGATDFATNFLDKNFSDVNNLSLNAIDPSFLQGITGGTNLGMTGLAGMINPQGNPYLESSIDNLWSSINKNLTNNILPAQRSEASIIDNYGSSRDYIAEQQLLSDAMTGGINAETAMRSGAYTTDQANALAASQAYTSAGLTADQLLTSKGELSPELMTAVMNLGMTPYSLPMDYVQNYAGTLSVSPTVIGQSSTDGGWNASFLTG